MNRKIDKSTKNKKKDAFFETNRIEPTTNPPKAER
jgi:hypothetical protein